MTAPGSVASLSLVEAMDLLCTLAICALVLIATAAYAVRFAIAGAAHHSRVEAEGKSALMSKTVMEMLMWCVSPSWSRSLGSASRLMP